MTKFRPCIDLHNGQVKQIVGATLSDDLKTNFVSREDPKYYAKLYKSLGLKGGHLIMLGPNNTDAALEILQEYSELQVGGGINYENSRFWLDHGAQKVIVTSYLFPDSKFDLDRLKHLSLEIGKENLVIDLRYFCKLKKVVKRLEMIMSLQ